MNIFHLTDRRLLLKIFLKIAACFALICGLAPFTALAQKEYPDSKGKDFWLTFLPNFHNNKFEDDPRMRLGDSLYIFVAATEPTTGKITYTNRRGQQFVRNFSISNVGQIYTFRVEHSDYEILGLNDSGNESANPENGRILQHSFHVETDKDVTVYALNQAYTTSDAFLVLPTDAVGEKYLIMSYNSDKTSQTDLPTPSEFAIVATENGTEITINATKDVFAENSSTINITLNKGDVYLIQANVLGGDWRADLTGSEIIATKPIAVFSGHQRATTPIYFNFGDRKSRDHLVEQMPPIDTWGSSAFLVPYPIPADAKNGSTNAATDSYRVLSGYDSTVIKVNDGIVATLNRGEFFEAPLQSAAVVKTSRPALVAQFKKTSDISAGPPASKLADPFMMLIPPSEQFLNSYRFINAQAIQYTLTINDLGTERIFAEKAYKEQYISVVAQNIALPSVRLDNANVPASEFKPIPGSKFSYATLAVSDGVHTIECDSTIGLYVFGYGAANSYGYIGGMSFRPVDFQPPQYIYADECFKTKGLAYDSLISGASYLDVIEFPESEKINVALTLDRFSEDSAYFSAQLNDIYQDGRFVIKAIDGAELTSRDTVDIPGFTISSQFIKSDYSLEEINEEIPPNKERCYTIRLKNYGKFPQEITIGGLSKPTDPEYRQQGSTNFSRLEPGESIDIPICFKSANEGEFSNTFFIGNRCTERTLASFKHTVVKDKKSPALAAEKAPCGDRHTLEFSEVLKSDMGLQSVEIIEEKNFTFTSEINFPETVRLSGVLTNPYEDGYYAVRAMDSIGNVTEYRDTIQGFTISFPSIASSGAAITYQENPIGVFSCDSLEIKNHGNFPFVFDNIYTLGNTYFSLPQSQFPITLQPGETRRVQVCYRPLESTEGAFRDTLIFSHNCLLQKIPLEGASVATIYSGEANCGVKLRLTTEKVADAFVLKQNVPNPVQQRTSFTFAVAKPGVIKITLYDSRGTVVAVLLDEKRNAGVYDVEFTPGDLPNGIYFYEMQAGATRISRTMVIAQ